MTDPDVLAGHSALADYIAGKGWLNHWRIYPAQGGIGSGTTVHGWGSLTGNHGTLEGSHAWRAGGDGIDFTGGLMRINDFLDSGTLTVWSAGKHGDASTLPTADVKRLISQYDTTGNQRSWMLTIDGFKSGDPITMRRSSDGTAGASVFEEYDGSNADVVNQEAVLSAKWTSGGGRTLRVNKIGKVLTLVSGTAQSSRFDSNVSVCWFGFWNGSSVDTSALLRGRGDFLAFLDGVTPTAIEEDQITDLLNAIPVAA